jgi:5-methylcytosine-specific restriction endonuclease McrA
MTAKHKKCVLNVKNSEKAKLNFHCETCHFHTGNKTNFNIHCLTEKHNKNIKKIRNICPNETCDDNTNKNTIIKNEKRKKKIIPVALKRNVWNKHIGESIGKTLCLCCKLTDISQLNFSCGHITSEFNGGDINLDNLIPICVSCNSSMGKQNMNEFVKNCGL